MVNEASSGAAQENKLWKGCVAFAGIMITLIIYGILQEKIMRVPYGKNEHFKYSLFLVFCNRITTAAVSACSLVASKKSLDPVAPINKYGLISISNILTTTCQYEALKYVSFPVQTLAKSAKMIPVMVGLPADREQYIHRLGRTGRKGKQGHGMLLLSPWEQFFLSAIKDLPLSKHDLPLLDPETKKQVERALSHVQLNNKESAYQAWLGYYNSNKNVGRDKHKLVELANEFSRSMGLDNPPAIPKLIIGKMGLRNIPGLRSK